MEQSSHELSSYRLQRSMITLTVLVALNRENELKSHLRGAKNLGITKEKIEEMILHVAHYSGFPTAVSASQLLNKVWDEEEDSKNKKLPVNKIYSIRLKFEWVLYHNNFSLCSRKVRICLEEYKIDYQPVGTYY